MKVSLSWAIRVCNEEIIIQAFSTILSITPVFVFYSTHSWKRMCGSTIPSVMTTGANSSNTAVVRFHSDGAYSGKGFRLTYELEGLSGFPR